LIATLFAVIGGALAYGVMLALVVFHHLEPGDSTPVTLLVLPPLVLGVWTGFTTRGSRLRFGVALGLWAALFAWTLLRSFQGANMPIWGPLSFGSALAGACAVALGVRTVGRHT